MDAGSLVVVYGESRISIGPDCLFDPGDGVQEPFTEPCLPVCRVNLFQAGGNPTGDSRVVSDGRWHGHGKGFRTDCLFNGFRDRLGLPESILSCDGSLVADASGLGKPEA